MATRKINKHVPQVHSIGGHLNKAMSYLLTALNISCLVGELTERMLNYYAKGPTAVQQQAIHFRDFFYPINKVRHWC